MSRVILSEYRAKQLVFARFGQKYRGVSVDLTGDYVAQVRKLPAGQYVAKVDQGVKKRNQLGLVKVNRDAKQLEKDLAEFAKIGYRYALVESFVPHIEADEHYVSLSRTAQGIEVRYSRQGGVDIEQQTKSIQNAVLNEASFKATDNKTDLDSGVLQELYELFQVAHMTLLEINPFLMRGKHFVALDAAVQVDSVAEFFVGELWKTTDIRRPQKQPVAAEVAVEELNAKSPASLTLKVLNPNGGLFLLLSGGGASVVVADEVANQGDYDVIANYGEYSGNPTEDETFLYTQRLLDLLIASKAPRKILLIAGGVANFTDVNQTFKGIIRAFESKQAELAKQKLTVIVRRGGPNQKQGLSNMTNFLAQAGYQHSVHGPEVSLAKTVTEAVWSLA